MSYLICENIDCNWEGDDSELHCSDEDHNSNKPVKEMSFVHCPDCGGTDFEEIEEEEEDYE